MAVCAGPPIAVTDKNTPAIYTLGTRTIDQNRSVRSKKIRHAPGNQAVVGGAYHEQSVRKHPRKISFGFKNDGFLHLKMVNFGRWPHRMLLSGCSHESAHQSSGATSGPLAGIKSVILVCHPSLLVPNPSFYLFKAFYLF